MKIAFIGGHWSCNIGNAYYNLGAVHFLKKVCPNCDVNLIPDPPQWRYGVKDDLDIIGALDVDLVLFGGPVMNLRFRDVLEHIIRKLTDRKVNWGFLSAGMALYSESEVHMLSEVAKFSRPSFCFTRDHATADMLSDTKLNVVNGICTSAYLDECTNVPTLQLPRYVVANLDNKVSSRVAEKQIRKAGYADREIIWVSSEPAQKDWKNLFSRKRSYHSDLPYGYLSIFKSADAVFSDRVHTCAAALALGRTAQYLPISPRSKESRFSLFENLGVGQILEKPVRYDFDHVRNKKAELERNFRKALETL